MIAPQTLALLEFDKVLPLLAELADSAWGRELALGSRPRPTLAEAQSEQQRLREWAAFDSSLLSPPRLTAPDLRPALDALEEGAVLEPADLLDVVRGAELTTELAAALAKVADVPLLVAEAHELAECPALVKAIRGAIDERGEVRDEASPELYKLRRAVRVAERRLTERLEHLAQSLGGQSVVTRRRDRLTVSVPNEKLGSVRGIVHDRSQSGATAFVEPLEVVELQNQVEDAERDERAEVVRILTALSAQVAGERVALRASARVMAAFDALRARYRLWKEWRGTLPVIAAGGPIALVRGRHPLLARALESRGEELVPLELTLDDKQRVLVVTGPNMGGKTVALKTLGLLTLLGMAGLPIPAAEGARIGFFDHVVADIGDEQSIEHNLSTFASHLRRIRRAVELAGPGTLVLLDELGAGTDPAEGAALGQAVLEHLNARRAICAVTTHHGELKTLAVRHPAVKNASMSFDVETHDSRFELVTGVPGRSFAIDVADRLGMPSEVLERARSLVSRDEARLQELIVDLDRQRQGAARERRAVAEERTRLESARARYAERLEGIRELRDRIRERTEGEAKRLIEKAEEAVREARRVTRAALARGAAAGGDERGQPGREIDALAERVRTLERETRRRQPKAPAPRVAVDPTRLEPGQRCLAPALGGEVEVIEPPTGSGRVRVRRGAVTLEVDCRSLELQDPAGSGSGGGGSGPGGGGGGPGGGGSGPRAGGSGQGGSGRGPGAGGGSAGQAGGRGYSVEETAPPPLELDLRGMRGDEAESAVERHLDRAVLHDVPTVRIIHGKGTGELRRRVQALLHSHPLVGDARDGELGEGGSGVTIATIRR